MEGRRFTNWAETFSCQPELYFEPSTVGEIKQILDKARTNGKKVKVCGSRCSPSDIAFTSGYLISLCNLNRVLDVDMEKSRIKVEAGVTLATLNKEILPKHGLGFSVLGAISDQTIAGAISTGTHGTGLKFGILATKIIDLDLLKASGELVHCSRQENPELFSAACCGLGALGVIVTTTIQCEPAFKLEEKQMSTTLDDVLDNLDFYLSESDHFRFMWYPHTDYVMMSHPKRTNRPIKTIGSWFWDKLFGYYFVEFLYWLSTFCGALIPWINWLVFWTLFSQPKERVNVGHKVFNFDCLFKQFVTEWAIPREKTGEVLRALRKHVNSGSFYAHMPTEVRFVKADDIMISPANGRETCYINILHFRPYGKTTPHDKFWAVYEDIVRKAGGRPHWAKAHSVRSSDFNNLYPEWGRFCEIRQKMDPDGLFLNEYLERILSD